MIEEIICGGQTGVDLAAAQAAIDSGIKQGGFCPKGRTNENGIIPYKFNFTEIEINFPHTAQENLNKRTIENIRLSDATLIIVNALEDLPHVKDGTRLTHINAQYQKKPILQIALVDDEENNVEKILKWIKKKNIKKLNIAGPRESTCPGIYERSLALLKKMCAKIMANNMNGVAE